MTEKKTTVFGGIRRYFSEDTKLFRLVIFLVAIFVFMSIARPSAFLSRGAIVSMATQISEIGIFALAISLAMILGGIDISVVALGNLCSCFAILIVSRLMPVIGSVGATVCAIAAAMVIGAAGGTLNGVLIAKVGVPSMLATLGTSELFTGICMVLTEGTALYGMSDEMLWIGGGKILGIPVPFVVFIVLILYFAIIFTRRVFGKQVYLVGSNAKAASFSGIANNSVVIRTHMLIGVLASIAGLLVSTRAASVKADYGSSYTLQCIFIAVLAGIDPSGGSGKLIGVLFASYALQICTTGLNMLSVSAQAREMVWGVLLIAFMIVNYYFDIFENKKKIATLHGLKR